MVQKAIDKLRAEMNNNPNNGYIQIVGQYLIDHVDEQSADKILSEDKSVAKSLDAMRKVAEKKKVGNCAVLTPDEGFKVVMDYFGITGMPTPYIATVSQPAPAQVTAVSDEFDLKLEDLL